MQRAATVDVCTTAKDADSGPYGYSLPPEAYLDPVRFEAERTKILFRNWIPAVRASDIPEPGNYIALNFCGEPIIVARGLDGEVRALSNVCRHRGIEMLQGEGKANGILCPYHQWSYKLDGSLAVAPFMDKSSDFDKSKCALPQFRTENWLGWIMVNLDPQAKPVGPMLTELETKLPADLADWVTTSVAHFQSPFNWKIIVENGSESYHNSGTHLNSIQGRWPGGRSQPIDTSGQYCEVRHPIDPLAGTFTAYTVFPLMTFTHQEPDASILWYDLRVNGIADCDMYLRVLMPKKRAENRHEVERMREAVKAIHQEDVETCTRVQRGLRSQMAAPGPLSHLEYPLRQMHDWIDDRLQGRA